MGKATVTRYEKGVPMRKLAHGQTSILMLRNLKPYAGKKEEERIGQNLEQPNTPEKNNDREQQ